MDATPAFSKAEGEILLRVRDLALVDDPPILLCRPHRRGDESEARLRFLEDDIYIDARDDDERLYGELSASGLDRVREFASELGHSINDASPLGVRWTVAIHFRRFEPTFCESGVLLVLWAIVPDPNWVAADDA